MSIKVGDKIKVVNAQIASGIYKNGDVFTVHSVKEYGTVFVKEHDQCVWASEYEVVKETPKAEIKPGDKVRLIDKFYEHEAFKADSRWIRKQIASLNWKEFYVKATDFGRIHSGLIDYSIPPEILKKIEPDRPVFEAGKSYVFDKTLLDRKPRPDSWESDADGGSVEYKPGNWGGSVRGYAVVREWCREAKHRYTADQIAEAQRIIGEIVAGFHEGECFYVLAVTTNGIAIRYRTGMNDCYGRFDSRCSPNDQFNRTIGVMVALCRAVGRKLPDWIYV